jgi:cystathionine beta-lyase/cystathionine gamma-synthase
MTMSPLGPSTLAVHAGAPSPRIEGSAVTPIFQGSVFEHTGATEYSAIRYPRLSNLPSHRSVCAKLAALEGTEAALVTASGMAAITTAMFAVMAGGGHLLAQNTLYGGTFTFLRDVFKDIGFTYDLIDPTDPSSWEGKLRDDTLAIYTEAVGNPNLVVADHTAVVDFAQEHGLVSMIDSTFASPVNFNPAAVGYDIVLHSATKYLNGHSDLAAGVIAASEEWIDKILPRLTHLGGTMDPHSCFLLERGIKTLVLRVERQNANALAIAEHLEGNPAIDRVHYPGLESHKGHTIAKELFRGFGGMVTFEVKGDGAAAAAFIDRLRLPIHAPSLGGVESLVTRPVTTSHLAMTTDERAAAGVTENMVRMSVGIEDVADLIADIDQALAG